MRLRFIGKDEKSGNTGSPTVFLDVETEKPGFAFQGLRLSEAEEAKVREAGPVPDHETVVWMPVHMIKAIREACDEAERSGLL